MLFYGEKRVNYILMLKKPALKKKEKKVMMNVALSQD